jgi:hypothetical protein
MTMTLRATIDITGTFINALRSAAATDTAPSVITRRRDWRDQLETEMNVKRITPVPRNPKPSY